MPFGLIVGFNSHFQSVIFAGVLLTEEKVENFEWLFREFVKMMSGKNPLTILTDQCRAMEVAIGNVLPKTKHRWCKWHVLRKAKERLGSLYGKVDFHRIVNQMLTKEEFEGAWVHMLSTYALEKNPYLYQIYETRAKWAKPYLAVECDGLGLEERLNAKRARVGGPATQALGQNIQRNNLYSDAISLDAAILAPSKNRSGGRPTSSCDKPPYEATSKRTRFCTICRLPGHKSTTCPDRPPGAAKPRKEAKCSNCGLPGHRKTSCVSKTPAFEA